MLLIADHLFQRATFEAVIPRVETAYHDLRGGNTAALVSVATTKTQFVFKADHDAKLLREARLIEELRRDRRLGAFSAGLPQILAVWEDGPPFAYVMEFFNETEYATVKQLLFSRDGAASATKTISADVAISASILALRDAYVGSRNDRQQVRLMSDAYYARMAAGLSNAETHNERFESRALNINGTAVPAWKFMLEDLAHSEARLQALAAPFVTVVHGDPNPGNILLKCNNGAVQDIKFIDLKDWRHGDYIFDLAKLTHFLMYTGPLEELRIFTSPAIRTGKTSTAIEYSLTCPNPVASAIEVAERHTESIAAALGDTRWRERYNLAVASNLLGLLPGRLRRGAVADATVLFGAGLHHLHEFLRGGALAP